MDGHTLIAQDNARGSSREATAVQTPLKDLQPFLETLQAEFEEEYTHDIMREPDVAYQHTEKFIRALQRLVTKGPSSEATETTGPTWVSQLLIPPGGLAILGRVNPQLLTSKVDALQAAIQAWQRSKRCEPSAFPRGSVLMEADRRRSRRPRTRKREQTMKAFSSLQLSQEIAKRFNELFHFLLDVYSGLADQVHAVDDSGSRAEPEPERHRTSPRRRARKSEWDDLYKLHEAMKKENPMITDEEIIKAYRRKFSRRTKQLTTRTLQNYRCRKKRMRECTD